MIGYQPPPAAVVSLLELSDVSFQPDAADFPITRFFPFAVWVDSESTHEARRIYQVVIDAALDEFKKISAHL